MAAQDHEHPAEQEGADAAGNEFREKRLRAAMRRNAEQVVARVIAA